ncbi:hypothetical protein L596_027962 [Steinernema carpocapsae]|uniref:Uncharacterized protein n=1 Tax=Steinernema carpocapsae TaxID=34508 RepID=A0A4U5LX36_STECR|nr:hypothetical protein L596_027962 [Steinernema carpocapsae]
MVVYWIGAVYGLTQMQTDLSVQKLAMPNCHIVDFKNRYDDTIQVSVVFTYVFQIYIFQEMQNDDTLFVTRATSQTPPKWSVWNP